ncbi:MAG: hypothetical protein ACFCUE_07920 [Candidatus Bathyarchaeia archaeon]
MKKQMKEGQISVILFALLAFMMLQVPTVNSVESITEETALSFITNVLPFDVTKYEVTLEKHSVEYPEDLGGAVQEALTYKLASEETKLDVFFTIRNQSIAYCLVSLEEGSKLFPASTRTETLETAQTIMNKYQKWTGDASLETLKNMLPNVDESKNSVTTLGNVALEVLWHDSYASFYWRYTFSGTYYAQVGFGIREDKFAFGDDRGLYKAGSTEIAVSKQEAISIASKYAEDYTWKVNTGNDTTVEVTDFKILEDQTTVEMLTWPREPLTIYPYWSVKLSLNQTYPGFVNGIHVGVWAENGEILFCYPIGWGGNVQVDNPNIDDAAAAEQDTTQPLLNSHVIAIAVIAVAVAFVCLLLVIKKRKR